MLGVGVGLLDGFGIAMFLPLLQLMNETSTTNADTLGNLKFLINIITSFGLSINILSVLLFIFVFFILKAIVFFFNDVYSVLVKLYFTKKVRVECIEGLNEMSYKSFVQSDVGQIQNSLTAEIERLGKAYDTYYVAIQQGIMLLVYVGFAFFIDVQFTALVCIGGVLTNFIYKRIYTLTKKASYKLTQDTNNFQGLIIQFITNFKYLKATGLLFPYAKKMTGGIDIMITSDKKLGYFSALIRSTREPAIMTVFVGIIFLQTSVLHGSLGPIIISLLFFYRALNSLMFMQTAWNGFLAVSGSLVNITQFKQWLTSNKEVIGKLPFASFKETIKLDNVSFNYGSASILRDITLNIEKNETVAFVGESGSGKTTLVSLIAGLMPLDSGEMTIDNIKREDINILTFQKRVGYISQDAVVFNDTVFNNVTFWAQPTADNKEKFNVAIKKASIFDFVQNLENKECTMLGNNGINLSGGQKQRISIARELYKDIDILILDEATSALDSETEKAIQNNIDDLKGLYTILIVAHRLSTIKNANRIVFMDKGQISNIGGFSDLINKVPNFKKMVQLQDI